MNLTLTTEPNLRANLDKWPTYRLFGLTMASDFSFANRLANGTGIPDLTFTCLTEAPPVEGRQQTTPLFASATLDANGDSLLYFYRQAGYDLLHFTGVADFYLWPERIICHLLDPAYDYMVEIHLLGGVLSLWLEQQGIPALHASAVAVDNRALAFLASNTGGKSSLAASLMLTGYPLLTDDILPIEERDDCFVGRPGYPQMRMWPDQARHFVGDYQNLQQVHPALSKRRVPVGPGGLGAFCDVPQPLAAFYLPEQRDPAKGETAIEITRVPPGEAIMEFIRHAFVANIVETMGLPEQRLHFFARLAQQVPMYRIIYPKGLDLLPDVRRAILSELDRH